LRRRFVVWGHPREKIFPGSIEGDGFSFFFRSVSFFELAPGPVGEPTRDSPDMQ
jgi:hypothetical protein